MTPSRVDGFVPAVFCGMVAGLGALILVGCPSPAGGGRQGSGGATAGGSGGAASTGGATGSGGAASTGGAPMGSGGAAPTGGRMGSGGRGGAPGDGAGGSAGSAGNGGTSGGSWCAARKLLLCEDFESTAAGAVPTGWTKHGAAVVASGQAAHGAHALMISAAINGERRIYADATKLGSGHWGRVFYRVETPAPISCDTNTVLHSTFVAFRGTGPVAGDEEVRVVDTVENAQGKHQFLYNVQPSSGAEFGTGSPYNWQYDGAWHCAEWHIDNPTQSYHFYLDGTEVKEIAIDNGMGKYTGSDIPPVWSQLRVGINNYQKACAPGMVAWIDELAIGVDRVGCGP